MVVWALLEVIEQLCAVVPGCVTFTSSQLEFYFCELGAHAKYQNPRTTPSGSKICDQERGKKYNPKNSGHFVPLQRPRAAQSLCLDQSFMKVQYLVLTGHANVLYLDCAGFYWDGIFWWSKKFNVYCLNCAKRKCQDLQKLSYRQEFYEIIFP